MTSTPVRADAPAVRAAPVDVAGARRARAPWTWVWIAVGAVLLAQLGTMLVRNPNFQWDVVADYLFSEQILHGLVITLYLTVLAMVIGIVLGAVIALLRTSSSMILRGFAAAYIWVFRGTPQLVQLIAWFNIGLLVPRLGIGIPFGPTFVSGRANDLITPFLAAVVGLGLHEAAYQAEIYRAGLLAVDEGQVDAAKSIGLTPRAVFVSVRLPQAMRFIVPPTFSQIIGMVKGTAQVSVIGGAELLFAAQEIYSTTFETIPLLIVVCIWYLIVTTALNVIQVFVEAYYGRGASRHRQAGVVGLLTRRGRQRPAAGEEPA